MDAVSSQTEPPAKARTDLVDIRGIAATLRRHFVPIAVVVGLVLAITLIAYLQSVPVYTASARVGIDRRVDELVTIEQGTPALATDSPAVDTEVQILRSPKVAAAVVDTLRLASRPGFGFAADQPPLPPGPARIRAIEVVRKALDVRREGTSFAITVSYSAEDPELVANIVNTAVQSYVDEQRTAKSVERDQDISLLRERLLQLRGQVIQAETAVARYRAATNLVDIEKDSTSAQQALSVLNTQLADAMAQQAAAEARLNAISRGGAGGAGEALGSAVLVDLRTRQAALNAQRADLAGRYGERHPTLANVDRQLAEVNSNISDELARIRTSVATEAQVARGRTSSIQGSIARERGALMAGNNASVRLNELARNAEAARSLYQALLARYQQSVAGQGTERSNAYIIARAVPPRAPVSPNRNAFLLGGILAALIAAALLVLLRELLENGFRTRRDVEKRLDLPVLATVPDLRSVPDGKRAAKNPSSASAFLVDHEGSVYSESYRLIRTALKLGQEGQLARSVAITSPLPREGKTTAAISLARSAALAGHKVVLVDCDLRQRASSRHMRDNAEAGLVQVLRGEASLDDALVLDTVSGAYLLPQRAGEEREYDVIASRSMKELLAKLVKRFDLVVLDTAPVLPVADARAIAAMADTVLLVVRWRKTPGPAAQMAVDQLRRAGAQLGGALLTLVDLRKQARAGAGDEVHYYHAYKKYYA